MVDGKILDVKLAVVDRKDRPKLFTHELVFKSDFSGIPFSVDLSSIVQLYDSIVCLLKIKFVIIKILEPFFILPNCNSEIVFEVVVDKMFPMETQPCQSLQTGAKIDQVDSNIDPIILFLIVGYYLKGQVQLI